MSSRLEKLQRTVADLVLSPHDEDIFRSNPHHYGAQRGLDEGDQKALYRYRKRLLAYRSLVRFALIDPLPDCFPVSQSLLEDAGVWEDCLRDFLARRSIQSPYYRDVNPTFVTWLAESGWGKEHWPFLLPLAHYEYMELEVLRHPDEGINLSLQKELQPDLAVVFDGSVRNLSYAYAVHKSTVETPIPVKESTHLLCYRDGTGDFQVMELTPHASAFLALCEEGQSLYQAVEALGLESSEVAQLLKDLQERRAVLGFIKV